MLPYNANLKEPSRQLRNDLTEAEKQLWSRIKLKQLGCWFYRQKPIGGYIVDFYCPKAKLIVEVDGGQHFTCEAVAYDKVRNDYMASAGLTVLRFRNSEVTGNIGGVVEYIKSKIPLNPPLREVQNLCQDTLKICLRIGCYFLREVISCYKVKRGYIDMPRITYTQVNAIITQNGELFIPDIIEDSILEHLSCPLPDVKKAGSYLKDVYEELDRSVTVDYTDPVIVDAYSLFYMRRNTIIPRVALRDLSLNNETQSLPDELRVLDVGSGTGAVVLGLLEMFLHPPLNKISVQVDAIDASGPCLSKLESLLEEGDLSKFRVRTSVQDIRDIERLSEFLAQSGPYDMVFAANVFNEISGTESCAALGCLSKYLNERAVIVIASAQRNFIKGLQPKLLEAAQQSCLYVYYPCSRYDTRSHECFFWREHDYKCRRMRSKGGQFISSGAREQLVATWLILCNQNLSIFDDFKTKHPEWNWGVFSIYGKDSSVCDCQACTETGRRNLPPQPYSIKRGAVVGFTGNPAVVQQFVNL